MVKLINKIVYRELLLFFRKRSELLNPLGFFILVTCLFPLATTPDPKVLIGIGPGIIWVAALLASLLSINKLFSDDYRDGAIEQMLVNPQPLACLVFAKIIAHWLMFGLPLVILAPVLGLMYHLPVHAILVLCVSLFLGTPIFSWLGAMVSALTVGLRNNGMLLALILVPLYIPPLIFGASAVIAASAHLPVLGSLAILAAILVLALAFAPMVAAFALRIGVSYD